jgi:hypothetical protein
MLDYFFLLGYWLDRQRQYKKGNGSQLNPERFAALQSLVEQGLYLPYSECVYSFYY